MSELANCSNLKSFSLFLISAEIGFIGISPVSTYNIYEDFVSFYEEMKNKIKNKDISDENCYFNYKNTYKNFDVDFKKDINFVLKIVKKINAINSSIGVVDDIAINLNVNSIYENVGEILNNEDEYFKVLEELWNTFITQKNHYGIYFEKTKQEKLNRLKHSFVLSDERIDRLKNLSTTN